MRGHVNISNLILPSNLTHEPYVLDELSTGKSDSFDGNAFFPF